jgi:hypothetical protein
MPPGTTTAQQPALSSNPHGLICPSRQPRRASTTRHDTQVPATAAAFAGHLAIAGSLLCVFVCVHHQNKSYVNTVPRTNN